MAQASESSTGTCALCGQSRVLQNSHLIPKWAYRRLQQTDTGRANPILVSEGSATFTSQQITQHLLCEICEDRFSKREGYVAKLTAIADGTIKIMRYVVTHDDNLEAVELGPGIDLSKLCYFAMSVIWRSHAMGRNCQLGEYEPQFRSYLLEESPFPADASLSMAILQPSALTDNPHHYVAPPSMAQVGSLLVAGFMICGLVFQCFIGRDLRREMKLCCLGGTNPTKYALLRQADKLDYFADAFAQYASATPRGKYADDMTR